MANEIPKALLDLMLHEWKREKTYSAFESNFEADRIQDPSFYAHLKDGSESFASPLTIEDVEALINSGVLDGLHIDHKTSIAVNEHAEHAITDFASDVYKSWDRLQARLTAARMRQPLS